MGLNDRTLARLFGYPPRAVIVNVKYDAGYESAAAVADVPEAKRGGLSPQEWFALPSNRPLHTESEDFIEGYNKYVSDIAERDGWAWPVSDC